MKHLMMVVILGAGFLWATLAMAQMSDNEMNADIVRVVSVIDRNEIGLAQLAEEKNIDGPIVDYARMIDVDNHQALQKAHAISQHLSTEPSQDLEQADQLRDRGEDNVSRLAPLDQDNFSREFISDLIEGDAKALAWIFSQDTRDGDVRQFLEETRQRIAVQLRMAQQLQEQVLR